MRSQVERGYNERLSSSLGQSNEKKNRSFSNTKGYEREDSEAQANDEDDYEWKSFFSHCFSNFQVFGYNMSVSPTSSQVMSLLNITNILKKASRHEEAIESEILFGLALISARRFLQAAEILRKVSDYFVAKSEQRKDPNRGRSNTPSSSRQIDKKDLMSTSLLSHTGGSGNSNMFLTRAAKIEIIISDAIVQHSMITRKVEALQKASEYFLGQKDFLPSEIGHNYDIYTALLKLCPILSKLLVRCLNDKLEPLRIAAIRTIEFLIDMLGSSMGPYIPQILKYVLLTYPNQSFLHLDSNRENFGMGDFNPLDMPLNTSANRRGDSRNSRRLGENMHTEAQIEFNFANFKAMVDVYNHTLETFLNFLHAISSPTLHTIFHDLLLPNIFLPELGIELRNYFFRLAERIINLCEGDLSVNVSFYASLLNILAGNHPSLKGVGQKLWEAVKNKIVYNMENRSMDKFIEWISESLYTLAENEKIDEQSLLHFQYFLDLVVIICIRERDCNEDQALSNGQRSQFQKKNFYLKDPINLKALLSPLLLWLDNIVNNQGNKIEIFRNLWAVLNELVLCLPKQSGVSLNEIALPLLWKVCRYCEMSSPTSSMLAFLLIVLPSIQDVKDQMASFLKEFVPIFAGCIPHSIYDETFEIFDTLIRMSASLLDECIIRKCIVALLDQYTMKSKAYKQSKEHFIHQIMSQEQSGPRDLKYNLFYITLKICLFENPEPFQNPEVQFTLLSSLTHASEFQINLNENKKNNTRSFDSKQFAKSYEDFLEKLQFAEEVLCQGRESAFSVLYLLISDGVLQSSLEKLIVSGNSKVRAKAMDILKSITELFSHFKNLKISQKKQETNTANLIEEPSITFIVPEFEATSTEEGANKFTTTKLAFCRFASTLLKISFDQFQDPKIQFYALALLDKTFENFLPPLKPTEELERFHNPRKQSGSKKIDLTELDNISCFSNFEMDFDDETYLHYRLSFILKFWPQVQALTQSPWSHIKILSQTLISAWVKPDFTHYLPSYQKRVKSYLFSMLMNLLTSKEAELRYWGLMILGSVCGMNNDFEYLGDKIVDHLSFFQRLAPTVSLAIWESVYNLQKDWNVSNKDAAIVLIQLAAPKDSIQHFYKLKKEGYNLKYNNQAQNNQNTGPDLTNKLNFNAFSQFLTGREGRNALSNLNEESSLNFSHMLKNINVNITSKFESPVDSKKYGQNYQHQLLEKLNDFTTSNIIDDNLSSGFKSLRESLDDEEASDFFWLEYSPVDTIKEALNLFRLDLKFAQNYWIDQLSQTYEIGNTAEEIEEMYDKLYIEADEVDTLGDGKIVGNPELLQKLNRPVQNLEEEIDLEELGIIELEDDEDLIDDIEHHRQELPPKTSSKLRPVSSRHKTDSKLKVHPNSPQGKNNHQLIQEYIETHLIESKENEPKKFETADYPDIRREETRSPSSNMIDKTALRPHNPVYRPLTPPLRNITPTNAQKNLTNEQDLNNMARDPNEIGQPRPLKMLSKEQPQGENVKKAAKFLRESPSAINLTIEDSNQPVQPAETKNKRIAIGNPLEDLSLPNFEEEPGQLEGDVIFLNTYEEGFTSPTQIQRKHNQSPDIFQLGKSEETFSFKNKSEEKSHQMSFGLSLTSEHLTSKDSEQKSKNQLETVESYSPGPSEDELLRPIDPNTNNGSGLKEKLNQEQKKSNIVQPDTIPEVKPGERGPSPQSTKKKGKKESKISPKKVPNGRRGKQKTLKDELIKIEGENVENKFMANQVDTIGLIHKNLGAFDSPITKSKMTRLYTNQSNRQIDTNFSPDSHSGRTAFLTQKLADRESSNYTDERLTEEYEELVDKKHYLKGSHYGYDSKIPSFTAPLKNLVSKLSNLKGEIDEEDEEKLQPKSEGNSMVSLQLNQLGMFKQKDLSFAMKVKEKLESSHSNYYDQINNLVENKRSSSNSKGSQTKKILERRKQPQAAHASSYTYSSNNSQNSQNEKPSPNRKDNLMKNILKKAVNNLKHDQRDTSNFQDKTDRTAKNDSVNYTDTQELNSTTDIYGILPKDKDHATKRSVSAEKNSVKYFNLPPPINKPPMDIGVKSGQNKQNKLDKKIPKPLVSQPPTHKKTHKQERAKDDRTFFPRKATPLKHNRSGVEYGPEVLEDISNQTM